MKRYSVIRSALAMTLLAPLVAQASTLDALVADLGGKDEVARSRARLLLPREDSVEAVKKILPLVKENDQAVWRAAFNTLADIGAAVSVAGRETERAQVSVLLMTLVGSDQPAEIQKHGLRLLPMIAPAGVDVGPVAALLDSSDAVMQEKARCALEETGTPEARAALRAYLPKAKPEFQCAILNSLGILKDAESLKAVEALTQGTDPNVRVAAARALAWTGDPSRLAALKAIVLAADKDTHAEATDAFIRLVNAIEAKGGNWEIVKTTYLDMLKGEQGVQTDAALAGLGRIGDGTCVTPMLTALAGAEPPTSQIGVDALRRMQGVDVARAIVAEYPKQQPKLQLALLGTLGSKKSPLVLPILAEAAKSGEPAFRLAALAALGESELAEALPILTAASQGDKADEKAAARAALLSLAQSLRLHGKSREAGLAYLGLLDTAADDEGRRVALEGVIACPLVEAMPSLKKLAEDKPLAPLTARALVAVGKCLGAEKLKEEAVAAYELARSLDTSPEMTNMVLAGLRDAGAAADYAAMLGLITRWSVVGPFELGEDNAGWDKTYISEPDVSLTAKYMAGKSRISWDRVKVTDDRGIIDLHKVIGPGDNLIGYAYTEVTVEHDTDAVLLIGADDSERVWVNGQKVFELFKPRGITPDEDKIPIKLKAGKNTILLKIWQQTLGWEFCARLTAPDGKPIVFTQKD